jgi:hypothetical protein
LFLLETVDEKFIANGCPEESGPRLVCYPHTREQTTAVMGLAVVHNYIIEHTSKRMSTTLINIVINPNKCPMVNV